MFRPALVCFHLAVIASRLSAAPASDDRIAAVDRLIAEGKAAEATMQVNMLRQLHPDDKRVVALQQKLGGAAPASRQAPSARPATNTASSPAAAETTGFTVLERVQVNAIETLASEVAELPPGTPAIKEKAADLLQRTKPILEKHPGHLRLWAIRALAALPLNDFDTGYEAGTRIIAIAETTTPDDKTMALLGELELKGWLGEKGKARKEEAAREAIELARGMERLVALSKPEGRDRSIEDLHLRLIAIKPGTFRWAARMAFSTRSL